MIGVAATEMKPTNKKQSRRLSTKSVDFRVDIQRVRVILVVNSKILEDYRRPLS
jgi:isocitrate dehydrogenase